MRWGSDMTNEIPARVMRLFGSDKARPKVTKAYSASLGWIPVRGTPLLSWKTVDELLESGSTSVEATWRFRTRQFSILDMRRPADQSHISRVQPRDGQPRRGRGIQD